MRTIRITGDVCALTFLLVLGACGGGPGQTSNPANPGDAAGNTGGAPLTVTYNPGGTSSLSGNVDSSLINRSAANTVYIYSGMVTPSGATTPFATTPATQDNGACTFSYQFGVLPANTYTVAVSNDGTTFRGISTVNVPATSTYNFPPNRLLR